MITQILVYRTFMYELLFLEQNSKLTLVYKYFNFMRVVLNNMFTLLERKVLNIPLTRENSDFKILVDFKKPNFVTSTA